MDKEEFEKIAKRMVSGKTQARRMGRFSNLLHCLMDEVRTYYLNIVELLILPCNNIY